MELSTQEARGLAIASLKGINFSDEHAATTADHLLDAAMRGVTFGGLPRILAISERMAETGDLRRTIEVLHETPTSILLDGGDNVGYVVAHQATRMAIEKAKSSGIAIVGARNTYYTGLFAYYLEMAAREGLIAFAVGNGPAFVAPEGSAEGRVGTNPIAFGFPTTADPVIWDIGTSAIMHGEVLLHKRLNEQLPDGIAIDAEGRPTTDPAAALAGAIRTWGGHKGSGLAVVVQLLCVLCGGPVITPGMRDMSYLIITIDPKVLDPSGGFEARATELAQEIRGARPIAEGAPVRMPFDRSAERRRASKARDRIELPDSIVDSLRRLASGTVLS